MNINDPIADMLTRIRNALTAKHETVDVPASKIKMSIAEILLEEGYVNAVEIVKTEGKVQDTIHIELKYVGNKEKAIRGLKRISKPGLRVYAKSEALPRVLNGLGIAIVSTSKGVMTDKKARSIAAGGEVLAYIW
jgi:small subunit ribosomal protein S8